MSRKEAIRELMKRHKVFKPSMSYVKTVFIPLIPDGSNSDAAKEEL